MTARAYLDRIRECSIRIETLLDMIRNMHSEMTGISSTANGECVSHSRNTETLSDAVVRMVDAEREAGMEIDRLIAVKQEAFRILGQLPAYYGQLLAERFITGMSCNDIALKHHFTVRTVFRQINCALDALQNLIDAKPYLFDDESCI